MDETLTNKASYKADWLASRPIFYNEATGSISNNINDVIDYSNLEFHPEGLNNFLDFGYSVFGQTPLKNIKFLRHNEEVSTSGNNTVKVIQHPDPTWQWLGRTTSESDSLELIRASIQQWEKSVPGEIVVPTSGGYDSRLLNDMISDKSRIRSFTYGISEDQSNSHEVVFAKKIAEILGTRFEQIPLGSFHQYFDHWDAVFGISTHAHGMYHFEFYDKISQKVNAGSPLLSGIIGDVWAGSVAHPPLQEPKDVIRLSYSHGMNADSGASLLTSRQELLQAYFEENRKQLEDPVFRIIESMRAKILLLSYLLRSAEFFGLKPWSPFLNLEVAMSMLHIPQNRRANRVWQVDYFRKKSLYIEDLHLPHSRKNNLNKQAMYKVPLKPLDVNLLREIIKPSYVAWINKHIQPTHSVRDFIDTLTHYPKIGGALRRLGVRDEKRAAYHAYVTLKPLETLIKKRNKS